MMYNSLDNKNDSSILLNEVNEEAVLDDSVKVVSVIRWTPQLFSFELERPTDFRYKSGEFVMLGLPDKNGRVVLRAYSMASPNWCDTLLFYSVIIDEGPLTSILSDIKPGDYVILKRKPTGTLILDALLPGKRLFLFATGTGIAPFASIVRDPLVYEQFNQIILTHTCRNSDDLNFGKMILNLRKKDPFMNKKLLNSLTYFPTVTREKTSYQGRITDLILSNVFFHKIGIDGFKSVNDRAMVCGSQDFNKEMKSILHNASLQEGSINEPGDFLLEKAFVG